MTQQAFQVILIHVKVKYWLHEDWRYVQELTQGSYAQLSMIGDFII